MTKSELNTIKYFTNHNISINKIPESKVSTPDFETEVNDQKIYLEVKELIDNPNEKNILNNIKEGEFFDYSSSLESPRIREKIRQAKKQFKKHCKPNQPGILIIQDLRHFFTQSINMPEAIKQAMFGDREIWKTMPSSTNNFQSKTISDKFGNNKKFREDTNTIISAIALLIDEPNEDLIMHLYHNPFSENPLNSQLIDSKLFREFKINPISEYNNFCELST